MTWPWIRLGLVSSLVFEWLKIRQNHARGTQFSHYLSLGGREGIFSPFFEKVKRDLLASTLGSCLPFDGTYFSKEVLMSNRRGLE
jgi:hypothetical protein